MPYQRNVPMYQDLDLGGNSWPQARLKDPIACDTGPRYTTHLPQNSGATIRHTEQDTRRFRAARQAIDAEAHSYSTLSHPSRTGADATMHIDHGLGWVDELVASPKSSPRLAT